MRTTTRWGKPARRVVAAVAVCGALALGTGATAFAATAGSAPGTTPSAASRCGRAPAALTRLAKVESAAAARASKLQAAESRLGGSGHPRLTARLAHRLVRLQRIQARAAKRVARIEARCPLGGSSGTTSG